MDVVTGKVCRLLAFYGFVLHALSLYIVNLWNGSFLRPRMSYVLRAALMRPDDRNYLLAPLAINALGDISTNQVLVWYLRTDQQARR